MRSQYVHLAKMAERIDAAAAENVFVRAGKSAQLSMRAGPADGRLAGGLHGWFFQIATAELFAYDPELLQFQPLVQENK